MGNTDSSVPSRAEEEWHKLSSSQSYNFGDRIEFNRGTYSHWALYVANAYVAHLNPANSAEKVGPLEVGKWFTGAVTLDKLEKVAGGDAIRVVRENPNNCRPREDIEMIIDIATEKQMFEYCLGKFNCEHFVNFVKFGIPVSNQILLLEGPKYIIVPSLFGPRVDPVSAISSTIASMFRASQKKFKTRPESTDPSERKNELYDICYAVAKEVKDHPTDEVVKYFFY